MIINTTLQYWIIGVRVFLSGIRLIFIKASLIRNLAGCVHAVPLSSFSFLGGSRVFFNYCI